MGCSEGDLDPNSITAGTTSTGGTTSGNGGSNSSSGAGGTVSGNGGSTPSAGSGGGGNPSGSTQTFAFDTGLEGFTVNYYCTATGSCTQVQAAPQPTPEDAGADGSASDASPAEQPPLVTDLFELAHDPTDGSPAVGSIRLTVQFAQAGQQVQLALNTSTIDMAGKTVRAQVRADVAGALAKLYLKSGENYIYADSGQTTLAGGAWSTLSFVATPPYAPPYYTDANFSAADIREMGVSFETNVTSLTPIVIHVDTFEY